MRKMWILLSILPFLTLCSSAETDANEPLLNKIVLTSPEYIKTKVGATVKLTLNVPESFDGSYSWSVNNHVVSTESSPTITLDKAGVGKIIATVKTNSGKSKTLTTRYFCAKNNTFQVLMYQPSWKGYKNQNWDKITHMCMCFGSIAADGSINTASVKSNLSRAIADAHENGVYALLSIGGGDADVSGAYGFTEALRNESTRRTLIANIMNVVNDLDLDGVDVDYEHWDYGMSNDNKVRSANLEMFYRDLRAALPDGYVQTTAIGLFVLTNKYFTDTMHQYLDLVNLMIYDATGPWASSSVGPHSSWDFYVNSVAAARAAKIPDSKIIPGVPFYGVKFKSATSSVGAVHMPYVDIVKAYVGAENRNEIEGEFLYYDGKPMVDRKARYVLSENLGGIMAWELTQDSDNENKSLLRVIESVLGESL